MATTLTQAQLKETCKMDTGKTKASLFNFVVYAPDERREEYLRRLVDLIIGRFPCRVLFVRALEKEGEDQFNATFEEKAEGPIVCDFIEITASGQHLSHVPFYLLPHLVPDRPLFLLWGQDPTLDSHIFPMISKYADRIIFDSDCSENIATFCRQMARKMDEIHTDVVDLNWLRISGWREAMSQVFDTEHLIHQLKNAKEMHIVYNKKESVPIIHQETPSLYFQAWLAERMDWKYIAVESLSDPIKIVYGTEESTLNVTITSSSSEKLPAGAITSLEIESIGEHLYHIECREETPKQLKVFTSCHETCDLPYTIPLLTSGWGSTFAREVLYAPRSEHYDKMLKSLVNEEL